MAGEALGRDEHFGDEESRFGVYLVENCPNTQISAAVEKTIWRMVQLGQEVRRILDGGERLNARERRRLRAQAADGEEAADSFTRANLRLVVSRAKTFRGVSGASQADIIQSGNLGLLEAVEGFDPSRDLKFSTYAVWDIRKGIQDGLPGSEGAVSISRGTRQDISSITAHERALEFDLERPPTVEEVAERSGFSVKKVTRLREARGLNFKLTRLNAQLEDGEEVGSLIPDPYAVSPEEAVVSAGITDALYEALGGLSHRQRSFLTRRFGLDGNEPQSYEAMSREEGISPSTVKGVVDRALAKLRDPDVLSRLS
jgi:RNA polymerase primary sigma factor